MGRTQRRRLSRKSYVDKLTVTKLDSELGMIRILQELHQKNPKFHKFNISPAQFSGKFQDEQAEVQFRGIVSIGEILPGTVLLQLPEELLITSADLSQEFPDGATLHDRFAFFLTREILNGKQSRIYNYIRTLPPDFCEHPIYLRAEELNQIPGVYRKILQKQSDSVSNAFKRFKESCDELNFENFKYCWYAVNTRSVFYEPTDGKREMALAPFLDLFNHSSTPNTDTYFDQTTRSYVIRSRTLPPTLHRLQLHQNSDIQVDLYLF